MSDSHSSNMSRATHRARIEQEMQDEGNRPLDAWRVFRIMSEFVSGFELLQRYGKAATVFGSARCAAGDDIYEDAREMGAGLSQRNFALITGGGGGVMSAANQGAYEAGGASVGINIRLPSEQKLNEYVHESENFHYFFTRKVMLTFASEVYVFFPGGYGTLDEFFELVTLIQTDKIQRVPIVCINKQFWKPLTDWIESSLVQEHKTISQADTELYTVVDTVDEALNHIDTLQLADTR